jgi:hypothetical protein
VIFSLKLQRALKWHEDNLKVLYSHTSTGELTDTASMVLADRIISDVIHPLIVADAIQELLGKISSAPQSNYLTSFEHRLQCYFFQTVQSLGVVDNGQ